MHIWHEGFIFSPPVVGIQIRNNNPFKIKVAWIHMEWPPENMFHHKFDLNGNVIWDEGNPAPPTDATDLHGNRYIDPFSSVPLVGVFQDVFTGFYAIEVHFDNGCMVYAYP